MTRPVQQSVTLNAAPRELFNTILDSKKHIVQSWRSQRWKASDSDSILILEFSKTESGGCIDLVHVGVPEHDRKRVMDGWKKYYWVPWRKRLASGQV